MIGNNFLIWYNLVCAIYIYLFQSLMIMMMMMNNYCKQLRLKTRKLNFFAKTSCIKLNPIIDKSTIKSKTKFNLYLLRFVLLIWINSDFCYWKIDIDAIYFVIKLIDKFWFKNWNCDSKPTSDVAVGIVLRVLIFIC